MIRDEVSYFIYDNINTCGSMEKYTRIFNVLWPSGGGEINYPEVRKCIFRVELQERGRQQRDADHLN